MNRLVKNPIIYDFIQFIFGKPKMDRILLSEIRKLNLSSNAKILDLGGGTGFHRDLFPKTMQYVCLDSDLSKLEVSSKRNLDDDTVQGNATQIPFEAKSYDLVLLTGVTHHVSDQALPGLLSEAQRVLQSKGHLVLFDPVYSRKNPLGSLFLKLDLGKFGRGRDQLYNILVEKFFPTQTIDFTMIHTYLVFVGTSKGE